ncbi:hypothetical protein TSUD_331900 [Trifolium subterraneum]|uniref:Uncharacterized protein n=1 Tax=Trifolium subterraneum TaxID=3900 RepID=A0A2Z6P3H7_TRISU|nr:hypothetical protein TSUD_331900 [Trifolium subterraneum]
MISRNTHQSRMMRKSHVRFPEKGVATYRSFDQPPPVNSALVPQSSENAALYCCKFSTGGTAPRNSERSLRTHFPTVDVQR